MFCIVFVLSYKKILALKHFVSLNFSFQCWQSTLFQTVQLLESSQDNSGQEAVEGYLSLARFADTQYQNIVNYMNSPTFEAKQALMNKAAAEYQKYSTSAGGQVQKELSQQLFAWYISLYSLWSETPSGVLWKSTAFCLVHLSVQFMVRDSNWGTVGVNSFLLGTYLCTIYGQRPQVGTVEVNSFFLVTSLYNLWSETPSGVLWKSTAFCLVHLSVQFMVRDPIGVLWESTAFCLVHLSVQFVVRDPKWGTVEVNSFLLGTSLCTVYGQRPNVEYCGSQQLFAWYLSVQFMVRDPM